MKCNLCFKNTLLKFLSLEKQPMANKYPKDENAFKKEKFFNVQVYFCKNCKNVQLDPIVSRNEMFEDYYYLSSVNKELVKHYEEFAKSLSDADFVVDIGSNDGILLKPLKEMDIEALGVDPSVNVGKIANKAGFETVVDFYDNRMAKEIIKYRRKADVIIGFSMFSHLQDQHQFIEDVKTLLTDDGKFIVEVEYNKLMFEKMAFERFYLDRVSYFSVTSFDKLFRMHGMYLSDAEVTNIHGGSIRVTAQKIGFGRKPSGINGESAKRLMASESKALTIQTAQDFGKLAKSQIIELKKQLEIYKAKGLKIAGYGSPARVSTLTNFGGIDTKLISFIVDDSPLKQNRFSPGKHIPIVSNEYLKEHPVDVLVFFAYESFKDIKKKLTRKYINVFPIPVREIK